MRAGGGAWHGDGALSDGQKRSFQLWVALPPKVEGDGSASLYALPEAVKQHRSVTVLLGTYRQAKSLFETTVLMNYFHVQLKEGGRWRYEPTAGHTVARIYPYKAKLEAGEQ